MGGYECTIGQFFAQRNQLIFWYGISMSARISSVYDLSKPLT